MLLILWVPDTDLLNLLYCCFHAVNHSYQTDVGSSDGSLTGGAELEQALY